MCFKRRSSDATKIRRFFHLCKYLYIILIISYLSLLLIFSAQSQNSVSKKERLLKHYLPFDKRQSTSYKNHFFPNASLLVLSFRYISG
ncbi:hypothetical protein M138_4623 [Bacteroides fragilis str. S23L17]|nr:hypothetical protein M138_4623 [Bacteroides fragilis str. S23L17]